MKYVLCAIVILYALLSMAAAIHQMKTERRMDTPVVMLFGATALVAAAVLQLFTWQYDWIIAIIGGAIICMAAYLNGKRGGNFHASHHIVRFVVTALFVVGFVVL
ncbi:MAG: hypothetical protein J1E60_02085 [Christensenellaceae bacterium]|nr:hypothetical protein [Christensenellaceae bacterium]